MLKRIDQSRRICIPKKLSKKLGWKSEEELEITIEYGFIVIKQFDSTDISKKRYCGIVRKLDVLNRIVIPEEYVKVLGIKVPKEVEIIMSGETLIIDKAN